MAITVGINKVVILSKYDEDGTEILRHGNVQILEMDSSKLQLWISKLFGCWVLEVRHFYLIEPGYPKISLNNAV
jgi:hypothetical protein